MNAPTRRDGDDGCGHLPFDPVCKCWGVYTTSLEAGRSWARINSGESANYNNAFLAAYEFRRMDRGGRYRVQRRETLGEAVAKELRDSCGHLATDAVCQCWGVHYMTDGAVLTPASGFVWLNVQTSQRCGNRAMADHVANAWTRKRVQAVQKTPSDLTVDEKVYANTMYTVRRYVDGPLRTYEEMVQRHETESAPRPCHLSWCTKLTTDRFCSDRCRDFGARVYVAEQRLVDFSKQLTDRREARQRLLAETRAEIFKSRGLPYTVKKGKKRKRKPSTEPLRGIPSELAWAREQTMADINAIERAWHAVQHESAVGDERFFPLLHDDE